VSSCRKPDRDIAARAVHRDVRHALVYSVSCNCGVSGVDQSGVHKQRVLEGFDLKQRKIRTGQIAAIHWCVESVLDLKPISPCRLSNFFPCLRGSIDRQIVLVGSAYVGNEGFRATRRSALLSVMGMFCDLCLYK